MQQTLPALQAGLAELIKAEAETCDSQRADTAPVAQSPQLRDGPGKSPRAERGVVQGHGLQQRTSHQLWLLFPASPLAALHATALLLAAPSPTVLVPCGVPSPGPAAPHGMC